MLFFSNVGLWIFLLVIEQISAVSYNQPIFSPNSSWNPNGTTVANLTTIGSHPYDIFINTNNTIYVPNQDNGQIVFWSEGNITSAKNISTNFVNSSSIFVTTTDDIYVDTFHTNGGVGKITSNLTIGISLMNMCQQCWDIFIDINNNLYCSLSERHQIIAKSLNNEFSRVTIVGGTGSSGSKSMMLNNPRGIFIHTTLDLYVADCGNDRIQFFRSGKLTATTIAGNGSLNITIPLNCPTSIILDGNQYLYIVDSGNHRIVGLNSNGFRCLIGCFGSSGSASNELSNPWSLSFDSNGNIFVSDQGNNRIQKFNFVIDLYNTTISLSDSPSLWSFNNNTLDSLSGFNGVGVNSPIYQTPGIDGHGSALSVSQGNSQYVNIPTFRNLTYRSFTIDFWFYSTALTTADHGLVGQCYAAAIDQSFHILIRNYNLLFAFYSDDLPGSTVIQTDIWYHVAVVYDYLSSTQKIYLNGNLEGSRSSNPYQGMGGALVIGKTEEIPGSPSYFSGYIDEVSLVMRTKNSSEILNDATLVTWNSFDSLPYYDSGPLSLIVTANNLTSVIGRVNQAISFTSNSSYYQVGGFVLLGISNYSFSIALWVRPLSINGSVLVHLSTTTNGQGFCVDYMGFSSTGQIIVTIWGVTPQQVTGPVLVANIWTHVVQTYSLTNGLRLYVNGTLINTTGPQTNLNSGLVNILTLGNFLQGIQNSSGGTCNSQSIVPRVYYGSIDEFQVYSRELNPADIYTLANP